MCRTYFNTGAASCTECLVNNRKGTCHGDRQGRTGLCTFLTADAAHVTVFSGLCTGPCVFAQHPNLGRPREKLQQVFRAHPDTLAAGCALLAVYLYDTVFNGKCMKSTHSDTVAETKASVCARARAAKEAVRRIAGKCAQILVTRLCTVLCALTKQAYDAWLCKGCGNAQDRCKLR